jgi:deoxyinosine 3'endonuclease (endonuclease V)
MTTTIRISYPADPDRAPNANVIHLNTEAVDAVLRLNEHSSRIWLRSGHDITVDYPHDLVARAIRVEHDLPDDRDFS